jgi:mRNA-degrading endonuclease RelE of RelBE toxin-antitoxin system
VKKELSVLSEFDNPADHQDVKPLTGKLKGFYRLRVGKYPGIFSLLKETKTLAVVAIAPRGDVY